MKAQSLPLTILIRPSVVRALASHIDCTSVRPSSSWAKSQRPARCWRRWRDDGGR